jgi:hypothetical protein
LGGLSREGSDWLARKESFEKGLAPYRDFSRHKNFAFFGGCVSRTFDGGVKEMSLSTIWRLLFYRPSSNILAGLKEASLKNSEDNVCQQIFFQVTRFSIRVINPPTPLEIKGDS